MSTLEPTQVRADHIGSFLRPPRLLDAMHRHAAGGLDDEQLREEQDAAILEILALQRDAGIDVYTDGEYRRGWFASAWEHVDGLVEARPIDLGMRWHGGETEEATATLDAELTSVVGGPISATSRMAEDERAFMAEHAPGLFKITLPGIGQQALHWFRPGITDEHYGSIGELSDAMAAILADEVRQLTADGVRYVQLDSLVYVTQYGDQRYHDELSSRGIDVDQLLADTIRADNTTMAPAREAGATTALHMCRGNNRSAWSAEGSYERVAERAFSELQVDRLLLEYDSDRAGGFEPLRFVRDDTTVVLGLISTKVPELESQDELLRRIEEASAHIPVDRLALSPQCGFASVLEGNLITWDDQRRKLELVAETARRVWG